MSAEGRRRVSAEMMARIDEVVSGHELQRSAEAAPQYVGRVDDRPLRFDEERPRVPGCGPISVPLRPPPHGRCPCGAHLEPAGSLLACPGCASTFELTENGWQHVLDGQAYDENGIRGPRLDFVIFDELADGPEATTAFFEGVDRARSRLGYPPDDGEVVEFEAAGPLTVTLPLGLPPGVMIHAAILDTTPFPDDPAREARTPFREAYEALQTAWTDLRLALIDRLVR